MQNTQDDEETNASLISCIEKMTHDNRIEESQKKEFKRRFGILINTNKLTEGALKDIIRFIYSVRNNIFHGTKTTLAMADPEQRKRLDIYSNILIATNQMLFDILRRKLHVSLSHLNKFNFNDSKPTKKEHDILNSEGTILGLHRYKSKLYLASYLGDGSGTIYYKTTIDLLQKYLKSEIKQRLVYGK